MINIPKYCHPTIPILFNNKTRDIRYIYSCSTYILYLFLVFFSYTYIVSYMNVNTR